jgi:hypothetical protein
MRVDLDVGFLVGFTVGVPTDGVIVVASSVGTSVDSMVGGAVGKILGTAVTLIEGDTVG